MTSDSESRVTRSRRTLSLAVALFAGGLALVTALRAQETPDPVATQPPPAKETPDVAAGTAAGKQPAPESGAKAGSPQRVPEAVPQAPVDAKAPPSGAARGAPAERGRAQEHFEPTEKVRADFDVSFPVDI